jgi:hypothetical protein
MTDATNTNTPAFIISLVSLVIGTTGLALSILNYRRDRSKVIVELRWNAETILGGGVGSKVESRWGHIKVINKGRRPVMITFVGLELPGRKRTISFLLEDKKLAEGESFIVRVPQDTLLKPFSDKWQRIWASAGDATDRQYNSRAGTEKPILMPGHNWDFTRFFSNIDKV